MSTSPTAERNANVYLYRVLAAHPEMMAKGLTPEQTQVMQEHLDHLKSLEAKRVIVVAGRTLNSDETTFGIVMFRADTAAAARDILNSDPGIQNGLFKRTLFPFQITPRESHEH